MVNKVLQDAADEILGRQRDQGRSPLEMPPLDVQEKEERRAHHWGQVKKGIRESVRFHTVRGESDGGEVLYRFHIPYFELPEGRCLGFLRTSKQRNRIKVQRIGAGDALFTGQHSRLAYKGMSASRRWGFHDTELPVGLLELDWQCPKYSAPRN